MQPIHLKHDAATLNGKDVAFRIRAFNGDPEQDLIAEGDGVLNLEGPNNDGMYDAFISVSARPNNSSGVGTWTTYQVPLYQDAVDCLKVLEDGSLLCVDSSLPS